METVKIHFVFTKDMEKARVFKYIEIYDRHDAIPLGVAFSRGFAGSKAIPLKKRR